MKYQLDVDNGRGLFPMNLLPASLRGVVDGLIYLYCQALRRN